MTVAPPRSDPSTRELVPLLLPIGVVVGLLGITFAITGPLLGLFLAQELHTDPLRTGAFLLLAACASVVVSTALARFSDLPGIRPKLMLGTVLASAVADVVFAVVRDYAVLLVTAMTLVAVGGSTYAQVFAHARQLLDRRAAGRAPMMVNYLRTIVSASWIIGPPAATALLGVIGFRGLFLLAAAFMLVAAVAIRRLGDVDADGDADADTRSGHAPIEGSAEDDAPASVPAPAPAPVGRVRTPWLAAAAFVAVQCASSLGVQAMPLFVVNDLHAHVSSAGAVLGLCAGLEIPLMIASGALAARTPLRLLVLGGAGLGVVYYAAVTASTAVWQIAVAQLVNAAFIACVQGLGITWFQDLMPGLPGRATTVFTNTNRMAALFAGPVFALAQTFGYRLAYGAGTVMCASGLVVLALAQRRTASPPLAER